MNYAHNYNKQTTPPNTLESIRKGVLDNATADVLRFVTREPLPTVVEQPAYFEPHNTNRDNVADARSRVEAAHETAIEPTIVLNPEVPATNVISMPHITPNTLPIGEMQGYKNVA